MEPRRRTDSPSHALENVRAAAAIAGVTAWWVARGALRTGPAAATLAVVLVVGALFAWRRAQLARTSRAVIQPDGVSIEQAGRAVRTVAWASIRAAHRLETSLESDPTVAVRFASIESDDGEPLAIANLEALRFATIELPDGRRLVHAPSADAVLDSLAARAPGARLDPGPRLDPIARVSRRLRLATAASVVALGNIALRSAHAIATSPGARLRLVVALAAGFTLAVAAPWVGRVRGTLVRVACASIACAAAVFASSAHSVVAAWSVVGVLSGLAAVAPRTTALPATTGDAIAYVDTIALALIAILAARGMTVVPLAALAWLATDRAPGELPPNPPRSRWSGASVVVAMALAAVALRPTLHQSDAALTRPARVLLE